MRKAPTVLIETHGCKLNQADSQALSRGFVRSGYRVVDSGRPADVYVLDTCSVTHLADRKARQALRAARRRNPAALIVATGCYAQREPEALEALPEVDLALGNTQKARLVEEVAALRNDPLTPCAVGQERNAGPVRRARAMVKVQEGCNQVCAYCIAPKVRGRERSIPPDALPAQAPALEEGFRKWLSRALSLAATASIFPARPCPAHRDIAKQNYNSTDNGLVRAAPGDGR